MRDARHWGVPPFMRITRIFLFLLTIAFPLAAVTAEEGGDAAWADAGITSLRRNAILSIGGEVRVDYAYRQSRASGAAREESRTAGLSIRNANLRLLADVHPNVRALFKLDFTGEHDGRDDRILEEALLVMHAVGGGGLELFVGKGRAPYGQDVTLGMIQSYHHTADRDDTAEGNIFLVDPPAAPDGRKLPPMRPGQIDRAVLAGAAYEWEDRWRVEVAAFMPEDGVYRRRLAGYHGMDGDVGVAGRVWWRPLEDVTVEASAMINRSHAMGRTSLRTDLSPGARGTDIAKAAGIGVDWSRGGWRVFAEYSHGWDWNFTRGYSTDAWQIGATREWDSGWRVGAMAESLRIRDRDLTDRYCRLVVNLRYLFTSGFFVMAEYGHEWMRRSGPDARSERRRADFYGIRTGFTF